MWPVFVLIYHLSFIITSIQTFPQTIQVAVGSTVELPCTASRRNDSINPAKIVWINDDRAHIVSLDSVITIRDSRLTILTFDNNDRLERILRFTNIAEQDQGLYRCTQADTILNEVLLDVLVPPHIVAHSPTKMPVLLREGRDVRFTCRATGRPLPEIVWHVNGVARSALINTTSGDNESVLWLKNVSRFDSGRIDCSASNNLSTVNRQFLLQVTYKPIVTVPFRILHYRLNESVRITCQVCSVPSANVFDFFRPKQSISINHGVKEKFDEFINQTCKQLTIMMHLSDSSLFGTYVCRARNSLGVNHAEFVLKEITEAHKHMKFTTSTRISTMKLLPIHSNTTSSSSLASCAHRIFTGRITDALTRSNSLLFFLLNIFLYIYIFFSC